MQLLTRRLFLRSTGRYAAGVSLVLSCARLSLAAGTNTAPLTENEIQALALLAHDIFPHRNAHDGLYETVAEKLNKQAVQSMETLELLHAGLSHLNELAGKSPWTALAGSERRTIISKIDTGPFFSLVRNAAVEVVYRDPVIWKDLDYGGSSIEHGGYLHHGFNDIDWLPEVD